MSSLRRAFAILLLLGAAACSRYWTARFVSPADYADLDVEAPFAKVHTNDGGVVVLASWDLDLEARLVRGRGIAYDAYRKQIAEGPQEVGLDTVALIETNRPEHFMHPGIAVMGVVTGASILLTAVCLSNTKACFGSCPTFYLDDGTGMTLMAEGFSASVARTLEETDLDALPGAIVPPGAKEITVRMTNEALETHFVESVRLLAVPRKSGRRIVKRGERFHEVGASVPPSSCKALGEDCLSKVRALDRIEHLSRTDGEDLAAREVIELRFPASDEKRKEKQLGLIVTARNSLLNTFLLYQTLAYMGRWAGDYLRLVERNEDLVDRTRGMGRVLGDLELEVLTSGGWTKSGEFAEIGPIAREVEVLPLPPASELPPGDVLVRLSVARGNYKIDEVALAELSPAAAPIALEPARVERGGQPDPRALASLKEPGTYLTTAPGDALELIFPAPASTDVELFLESRGYYYEWTRESWLKEEDPKKLKELLLDPRAALVRLAPAYRAMEDEIEELFWESRISRGAK